MAGVSHSESPSILRFPQGAQWKVYLNAIFFVFCCTQCDRLSGLVSMRMLSRVATVIPSDVEGREGEEEDDGNCAFGM